MPPGPRSPGRRGYERSISSTPTPSPQGDNGLTTCSAVQPSLGRHGEIDSPERPGWRTMTLNPRSLGIINCRVRPGSIPWDHDLLLLGSSGDGKPIVTRSPAIRICTPRDSVYETATSRGIQPLERPPQTSRLQRFRIKDLCWNSPKRGALPGAANARKNISREDSTSSNASMRPRTSSEYMRPWSSTASADTRRR